MAAKQKIMIVDDDSNIAELISLYHDFLFCCHFPAPRFTS